MPQEIWKHPDATVDVRCSFASDLQPGETITRVRWIALGLTVIAEQMEASETVMVAWIAGGFTKARYTVTCSVVTSHERVITRDVYLHVSDDVPMPAVQP